MALRRASGQFAKQPKVRVDTRGWKALRKAWGELGGLRVNVGVLASKGGLEIHGPDGDITLIEIAAIHEFGSPAANIPERSFIRRTFINKEKEIAAAIGKAATAVAYGMDAKKALDIVGLYMSTEVKKTVTAGEHIPPPLQPATIARKGSDRPLVDTGRLVQSVSWEVVKV